MVRLISIWMPSLIVGHAEVNKHDLASQLIAIVPDAQMRHAFWFSFRMRQVDLDEVKRFGASMGMTIIGDAE